MTYWHESESSKNTLHKGDLGYNDDGIGWVTVDTKGRHIWFDVDTQSFHHGRLPEKSFMISEDRIVNNFEAAKFLVAYCMFPLKIMEIRV